ncbi:hypothetical protein E2562_018673 [Oryza meyeriana var. granulata]|uniref:Uncharacterized protein n=1 Tax=Oryza meyeriana var. granulata TaxID=110450 RepID=A0A6G1BYP7_9ORYZ|nr:hypothetical protein E2562_018673 [Oryza meyeriana var. granulata]
MLAYRQPFLPLFPAAAARVDGIFAMVGTVASPCGASARSAGDPGDARDDLESALSPARCTSVGATGDPIGPNHGAGGSGGVRRRGVVWSDPQRSKRRRGRTTVEQVAPREASGQRRRGRVGAERRGVRAIVQDRNVEVWSDPWWSGQSQGGMRWSGRRRGRPVASGGAGV